MQTLFLAAACWLFWIIYAIVTLKVDRDAGSILWPLVKVAVAAGVAWTLSSVLMRAPGDAPADAEGSGWRPLPLAIRGVLAVALLVVGVGLVAFSLATAYFGAVGVVIGVACLPLALYVLVAGKYNPNRPL